MVHAVNSSAQQKLPTVPTALKLTESIAVERPESVVHESVAAKKRKLSLHPVSKSLLSKSFVTTFQMLIKIFLSFKAPTPHRHYILMATKYTFALF